ncbi:hypothetical protein HMPREF1548_02086 [Clostridium sp. KLE 1755]|nr:hypothetical protein HMPREF1548_02086 [Clostridium sp. KLE 1755]
MSPRRVISCGVSGAVLPSCSRQVFRAFGRKNGRFLTGLLFSSAAKAARTPHWRSLNSAALGGQQKRITNQ